VDTRHVMLIGAVVLLLAGASPAPGQMEIRSIDSDRILREYPGAQDIQRRLDELRSGYESEFQQKQDALRQLVEEIQSQGQLLSAEARAERERRAQRMQAELEQYYYEKLGPQGEYFQKNQEMIRPLQEKIQAVIRRIGKAEGYDYVLDTVQGALVYHDPAHDITDRVLAELGTGD